MDMQKLSVFLPIYKTRKFCKNRHKISPTFDVAEAYFGLFQMQKNILLIDDDPDDAEIFSAALSEIDIDAVEKP